MCALTHVCNSCSLCLSELTAECISRYLRIIEELQRAELYEMPREEKLSFFINLYNMMAIHAILVLGPPSGALERRKFLGDFKYVIGGSAYSLSAIYNGVLRGNQRPPYNPIKPFGAKDKRLKVGLLPMTMNCSFLLSACDSKLTLFLSVGSCAFSFC